MHRTLAGLVFLAYFTAAPANALAEYSVKPTKNPLPQEVQDPIRKLLGDQSIQFLDAKGSVLAEVWFRKEVPAQANANQVKAGLTYREVPESTVLGVMQVASGITDYRKQAVKPGVYTLRLGYQPIDGDHQGTAPHSEFCLALPIARDSGAPTMDIKEMRSLSSRSSTTSHPVVFLLFPGAEATDEPKVIEKNEGHWVVLKRLTAVIGAQKVPLGIALTLIGASAG